MKTINPSVILQTKDNSKLNPEVKALENTRIAWISEHGDDAVLNSDTLRRITGGDSQNLRDLHKSDRQIKPISNLFVLCNEMPNFSGEATEDRIVVFHLII